jgi:hypothetical protein
VGVNAQGVPAAQPVNIDKWLGKVPNKVTWVGVEMEGAWPSSFVHSIGHGARYVGDASVSIPAPEQRASGLDPDISISGEITTSNPILPAQMPSWVRKYYPKASNATCGLHIHMSFGNEEQEDGALNYARLMVPEFQETVVEYLKKWAEEEGLPRDHHLWPRLNGESKFCQKKFWADEQAHTGKKDYDKERFGHRYTIISYHAKRHGTIECRVLPMMTSMEQSIRALDRVIDITSAFLVATAKREPFVVVKAGARKGVRRQKVIFEI